MTKRILTFLLALIMCLSLAACGGDKNIEEDKKEDEKVEQSGDNKEENKDENNNSEGESEEEDDVLERIKRKYVYNGFYEYRYDENGNMIEECFCNHHGYREYSISYYPNGNTIRKAEYHYFDITAEDIHNEVGLLMQTNEYRKSGDLKQKKSYTYYEDDKAEIHFVTIDDETYEYKYEYDENGNLIKRAYHAYDDNNVLLQDNNLLWYNEYKYDGNGNIIEETTVNSNGKFFTIYEYDENNNLICEKSARGNASNLLSVKTYQYDENGNITSYSKTDTEENEITEYYTCSYNSEGNLIAAEISSGLVPTLEVPASVILSASYTYDENNMAVSCTVKEYIPSKKTNRDTVYEYVYDEDMNIISVNNTFTYDYGVYETTTDLSEYYSE